MGIKRTVSIRQIDLWGSEPLESKKNEAKNAKNWNVNFSFVFFDACLCKKDHNFRNGSGPRISISFFASGHLNPIAHFWPRDKYPSDKKYFSAHPIRRQSSRNSGSLFPGNDKADQMQEFVWLQSIKHIPPWFNYWRGMQIAGRVPTQQELQGWSGSVSPTHFRHK